MVQVRWHGNNSTRYDGRIQDLAVRFVVEEDRIGMAVGYIVRVNCGKQARTWTAVVVDMLDDEAEADDDERRSGKSREDKGCTTKRKSTSSKGGKFYMGFIYKLHCCDFIWISVLLIPCVETGQAKRPKQQGALLSGHFSAFVTRAYYFFCFCFILLVMSLLYLLLFIIL